MKLIIPVTFVLISSVLILGANYKTYVYPDAKQAHEDLYTVFDLANKTNKDITMEITSGKSFYRIKVRAD